MSTMNLNRKSIIEKGKKVLREKMFGLKCQSYGDNKLHTVSQPIASSTESNCYREEDASTSSESSRAFGASTARSSAKYKFATVYSIAGICQTNARAKKPMPSLCASFFTALTNQKTSIQFAICSSTCQATLTKFN